MKKANNTLLATAILNNRGYKSRKVTSEQLGNNEIDFKKYHDILDDLLRISYKIYADAYNRKDASAENTSSLYAKVSELYKMIGTLENGAKLRANSDTMEVLSALSIREKTVYSIEVQDLRNSIMLDRKIIRESTNDDGTIKNGMVNRVKSANKRIEENQNKIDELAEVENNITRSYTRISKNVWYARIEDYLADMILEKSIKSSEEIDAEEKDRKDARNKKANARKALKKAEEKKDEKKTA